MQNERPDGKHDNELVAQLYREIQADKEATKKLATLEQERISILREVLGTIQSLSACIGELSSKIDDFSLSQDERIKKVEESITELHRIHLGFITYLNNELQQELQTGRVTQEGLGQLLEKMYRGWSDTVIELRKAGVYAEGPPGFDKLNEPPVMNKTELLELLDTRFGEEDLRILCFRIGLDWDELEGDTRLLKIASLISFINNRRLAGEFRRELMQFRPDINGFNVAGSNRFGTRPLGKLADHKDKEM